MDDLETTTHGQVIDIEMQCRHRRDIYARNEGGIVYYVHDDNTSCAFLNRFSMRSSTISTEDLKFYLPDDTPIVRAALSNMETQTYLFTLLEALDGIEFKNHLQTIVKVYLAFQGGHAYIRPLVERYGTVMANNIKMLTGEDFGQFAKTKHKHACYDLRQLDQKKVAQQQQRYYDQKRGK